MQGDELDALIDRPNDIIEFGKEEDKEQNLDMWSKAISQVLIKVDRACDLIEKEILLNNRVVK